MAQIFKPKKNTKRKAQTASQTTCTFTAMTLHSQALSREHEPVIIASGGLPGEKCQVAVTQKRKNVWLGNVSKVLEPASIRKIPSCPHAIGDFSAQTARCGGCQFAYVDASAALRLKQETLSAALTREYGIADDVWVEPLDSVLAYRRKVRLAIDARNPHAPKIGFREAQSKAVVPITHCEVLIPELQVALTLVTKQTWPWLNKLGHIELMLVQEGLVLVLHASKALPAKAFADIDALVEKITQSTANKVSATVPEPSTSVHIIVNRKAFSSEQANETWQSTSDYAVLTSQGALLTPAFTLLTAKGLSIPVKVDDFMQVNASVNAHMVAAALVELDLSSSDRVLDLFCGSGNFTLPIAATGATVIGVEGVASMVEQANLAAQAQDLANAMFIQADLTELNVLPAIKALAPNKLLLDPARQGAFDILSNMDLKGIEKIVYVSCQPQTWLTDIGVLLDSGFVLEKAYCMDMFRHTTHTEVFSVLVKNE